MKQAKSTAFGLESLLKWKDSGFIDGWSLRQTNTRLKRCVSGSVIRVIAPHPFGSPPFFPMYEKGCFLQQPPHILFGQIIPGVYWDLT